MRIRSFLTEYRKNPRLKVRSVLAAPYFVKETAKIGDILTDMRQHKRHMAMVQDEDKKIVGLVTIEDILEELVGEIFDEEDIVDQNFQALGGNKYLINTHMLMGNAYERMGIGPAPRSVAAKPILSFVLETLGHLPEEEETFLYGDLEFTAKTVEEHRLTEVIVHILDEEDLAQRLAATEQEVEA
jgi:CBS domain containing-hemolysin-like protein